MTKTTTWYCVNVIGGKQRIWPVQAVSAGKKMITLAIQGEGASNRNIRCAIDGGYEKYFRTWREAHDYVLLSLSRKIETYEKAIADARNDLSEFQSMADPSVQAGAPA